MRVLKSQSQLQYTVTADSNCWAGLPLHLMITLAACSSTPLRNREHLTICSTWLVICGLKVSPNNASLFLFIYYFFFFYVSPHVFSVKNGYFALIVSQSSSDARLSRSPINRSPFTPLSHHHQPIGTLFQHHYYHLKSFPVAKPSCGCAIQVKSILARNVSF